MGRLKFVFILAGLVAALAVLLALGWLQGLAAVVLLIGLCILFHEAGHFLVARACGMKVHDFSVGFGPSLASFSAGGTEYHLRCVPVGGFVKIAGFAPGEDEDEPKAFFRRPRWMGALVLAAGSAMNVVLAALLFVLIGLVWGENIRNTNVIERIQSGMPAASAGLLAGDEIVAVDGDRHGTELAVVRPGSAAEKAGLKPDDRIWFVNGGVLAGSRDLERALAGACRVDDKVVRLHIVRTEPWRDPREPIELRSPEGDVPREDVLGWLGLEPKPVETDDLSEMISAAPGRRIVLTVRRDGRERDVAVVPRGELTKAETLSADGQIGIESRKMGRIGIVFQAEWRKRGVGESIRWGFGQALGWVTLIVVGVWQTVTGEMPAGAGGPIAIGRMVVSAAQAGPLNVLRTIALISANFAVINMLPIPALDGGHLAILGYESIIRRRISERTRMAILLSGIVLLGVMFLLITAQDIFDWILQAVS